MKIWRKCALLFLLALLILTVGAAACGEADCRHQWELDCVGEEAAEDVVFLQESDWEGVEAALVKGMREMQDGISVREYQIPVQELPALTEHLYSNNPDLFMVFGCGYRYSGGIVTTIYPKYTMSAEEYAAAKVVYDNGVKEIVEQVDPAWSDVEKLLFVHDYIASHYEYDMRVYDEEQLPYVIYDAYNFFRYGTGVCQAYTMVFMAAARELGLEVSYVESDHLKHIWNLVEVDGIWYHVDVTWDDPVQDTLGAARHNYFLIDDLSSWLQHRHDGVEGPDTPGHAFDWVYGVDTVCWDDHYLNAVWNRAVSPFVFVEEEKLWYFADSTGLRTWDGESWKASGPVDLFPDVRAEVSGRWYLYSDEPESVGLSLYDGKLYYNSRYTVKRFTPVTRQAELLLQLSPPEKRIFVGLRAEDRTLSYETYSFQTREQQYEEISLRPKLMPVGDAYRYRVEDGQLELVIDRGWVLMVTYDENGAMDDMSLCESSGLYDLPEGRVSLFAVEGGQGWTPLCEGVSL